ncbi:GTPase-activating protein [Wyeomyia smithii]|uniref:GTPase-activating protein n=1 Tax=Wyeomyia smithii TaxID=174621 RepID=UPI00246803DC|nr:GTPase-activating protein [Wyeomyia smithii]XP_055541472.1 GTPase-activating protein [Wyeomyia smithii]XP_055541473.1 GTPase-activating protein [Wyeomyia smithii]XP_055541474.1 GTPase-activating protein [Wyeomyia smithii]
MSVLVSVQAIDPYNSGHTHTSHSPFVRSSSGSSSFVYTYSQSSYGFNMADDTRKVRVEEQLKIKIGEAKNLLGRNGNNCGASSSGSKENRDVYCTVALDQEEICRTPTIERTLSPFFGEEYQFEIPRSFRYLSVYVWDRDRHLKQDKPYGKIAIKREDLHQYNHKDHWFPLRPVDEDSEVQGMAHLEITVDDGVGNLKQTHEFDDFGRFHMSQSTNNSNSSFGSVISSNGSSDTKENSTSSHHHVHHQHHLVNNSANSTNLKLSFPSKNSVSGSIGSGSIVGGGGGGTGTLRTIFGGSSDFGNNVQPFRQILDTSGSSSRSSRISIKLTECMDLARKNGLCDPFAILTAHYSNKKKITKRTKVRKKTVNPEFGETVSFDLCVDACGSDSKSDSNNTYTVVPLGGADLCEVVITFWHDSPGMGDDVFLGEIKLPVRGKQQLNAVQNSAWYYLQPRTSHSRPSRTCATPPGTRLSCDNSLGSLRLKLNYTADHVFPLATYDQLLNILIQSIDQKPVTASAVYILGEIIQNKTEVAQPLVRLFTHTGQIAPMIKSLADHEISKLTDPTTIFRGNTLVSKMMDEAMRLSGLHYLHNTLRPIVEEIFADKKPCEIDPARVKDKSMIDSNLLNLQDYVEKVFEAITNSAVKCPAVLCQIFHDLRECAAKYFPQNKEVRYSVVSGFIFLRFFAPAILGPKLFDLTTEPVDEQTTRTLTLISKTIQSLGNLVSSRSAQQPCKEQYTGQLYKKFCTEKHVEAIKHFLEVISTVGANITDCESTVLEPVVLKEGMMTKRAQGRKRFGRRNFKQRYFRLTTQSLSYAKAKGKSPICDIPLSEILAVERLTERSFKMQNIFQIVRKERPLYVQTANCVEEKEWVDLLSKICQSNKARLEHFHPCAYITGLWTCCKESDQYAPGCAAVSPKPFQMELSTALDPARDLQRLHSLIMVNFASLDPTLNATGDDPAAARKTIKKLNEIANSLERIHRKYKTILAREMRYGSRQAPIGDDNYLYTSRLMAAGNNLAATAAAAAASIIPQHIEKSPHLFHRNHPLRSSDNERFSQC